MILNKSTKRIRTKELSLSNSLDLQIIRELKILSVEINVPIKYLIREAIQDLIKKYEITRI